MKINITGASNFVNRMFEACGKYQWAREFLKNSIEAKATRVEFGIEWQAVAALGEYHRTVADNGIGMDKDELLRFFSTLGEGNKKIGGVHDNFGVGAKIASLPWNPEGVVVLSYREGRGSMIWILLDPESNDYELLEFIEDGVKRAVIDPDAFDWSAVDTIDWSRVAPEWVREHGTVVILLGSEDHADTVMGNVDAGEDTTKGLSIYLNSRFWDLSGVAVSVVELVSTQKNNWPENASDTRRLNNRAINGAKYFLTKVTSTKDNGGKLKDSGLLFIDEDRVLVEWYLWEGERPTVHGYAQENGYIAVRYNDELFQLNNQKPRFRLFGIIESVVQKNLTIILEPQHYQSNTVRWGIHPDQSRNRLIFTGHGDKGIDIPFAEWGRMFVDQMPEAVLDAIREARGETSADLEDEEYRRRLQDKFGDRWKTKKLVITSKQSRATEHQEPASPSPQEEETGVFDDGSDAQKRSYGGQKRRRTALVVRRKAEPGGNDLGVMRDAPVDVPHIRFAKKDEFEKPWHMALYAPEDPDGPTVVINLDSGIINEIIEYHLQRYPDVFAEEVQKIILRVFGEVAACKVAHSQKLAQEVTEEELNTLYRSEAALTVALMGLLAEESLITQRLGRLGPKKEPKQEMEGEPATA